MSFTTDHIETQTMQPFEGRINAAVQEQIGEVRSEMQQMESRVLRRLLDWMLPDFHAGPMPAHAVLHAHPTLGGERVEPEMEVTVPLENGTVHFSPVQSFRLGQTEVAAIAFGEKMYPVEDGAKRGVPVQAELFRHLPEGEIWLGLSGWGGGDLRFFFDWKNPEERKTNLQFLQSTAWFFEGKKLEVKTGIEEVGGAEEWAWLERRTAGQMLREKVLAHYRPFFHTVKMEGSGTVAKLPPAIAETFPIATEKLAAQNLTWLCLHLPKSTPKEWASGLVVGLNCFPVVQRKLYRERHVFSHLPYFCLEKRGERFFEVEEVRGAMEYRPLQFFSLPGEPGWQVRRGNVEMPAAPHDSLPDERTYLILRTLRRKANWTLPDSTVNIKFWTTQPFPDEAIPAFSPTGLFAGQPWEVESSFLVTTPVGQEEALNLEAKWLKIKSLALSRGRLVTPQDVRSFIIAKLKGEVKEVNISHGMDRHQGGGAFRVCRVEVELMPSANWDQRKCQTTAFELENELENYSSGMLPFRVSVRVMS